jgi:nicotinate-nucleotide adenylyltransferase
MAGTNTKGAIMKIGIFGGSFDPPHMGHFWVCRNAIEGYVLDKLFIVPNTVSPFKKEKTVEKYHTWYMTDILAHEVGGIIDDQEMLRPEPSYTWDTILNFRGRFPNDDLYLIVGQDCLNEITGWYRIDDILATIDKIIVIPRIGEINHVNDLPREKLKIAKPSFVQISSTELRLRLKKGKIITGLIPDKVLNYIHNNHLYL